jgi:acetoin utilization protein AcuB
MLVRERMTAHPITIDSDTSVTDAINFMRHNRVRRLPVLDKRGRLVGIVAEKDLLYASPSPATSLSVYEIGYLLSKLKVSEIMVREVITVCPDCPLEEAARIMVDHKIGGLPVVEGDKLVGLITETDLFKVFLEMFGAREQGWRASIAVPNQPGELAKVSGEIAQLGGDIVALGTYYGPDNTQSRIVLKVRGLAKEDLLGAFDKAGAQVLDIRE